MDFMKYYIAVLSIWVRGKLTVCRESPDLPRETLPSLRAPSPSRDSVRGRGVPISDSAPDNISFAIKEMQAW